MSLKTILFEKKLHFRSSEDLIKFLTKSGIDVGDKVDDYLASGSNGDVYKLKNNKVIKIENYHSDVFDKLKKMKSSKSPYIANIHLLKNVENFTLVVMDLLETMDDHIDMIDWDYADDIISNLEEFTYRHKKTMLTLDEIYDDLKKKFLSADELLSKFEKVFGGEDENTQSVLLNILRSYVVTDKLYGLELMIKYKKIIMHTLMGIIDMNKINLKHRDIHIENILYNKKMDTYQLIDPWGS